MQDNHDRPKGAAATKVSLDRARFEAIVARANLAPSIHNAQPTRWRQTVAGIEVAADLGVTLPQADPQGRGVALSVGAAIEATVLALGAVGIGAEVKSVWGQNDRTTWPGHRLAAQLLLTAGSEDPIAAQLENRLTWRGAFDTDNPAPAGWTRDDTHLVINEGARQQIADLNDDASLGILRDPAFRRELLGWMRLTPRHPRFRYDGLSRDSLRLGKGDAKKVRLGLGPLWSLMDMTGRSAALTAEAPLTMSAPLIALFCAPLGACSVATGRAYLRMWLEATQLGLVGWPMAALTDDPGARQMLETRYPIGYSTEIIQVLRFGVASGRLPARSRRPINEVAK